MQPLSRANGSPSGQAHAAHGNGSQPTRTDNNDDSGVVLRWRQSPRLSARAETPTSHMSGAAAALDQPTSSIGSRAQVELSASADTTTHSSNSAWVANPLRDSGAAQPATRQAHYAATTAGGVRAHSSRPVNGNAVRAAAYQAPAGGLDPFAGGSNTQQPPSLPPAQVQPMPSDPLSQPELAPPPPSNFPPAGAEPSQLGTPQLGVPELEVPGQMPPVPGAAQQPPAEAPSPFDRIPDQRSNGSPSDRDQETEDALEQLQRHRTADASVNCEYFRDRLRNATLEKINLKSGPRYGEGLGSDDAAAEKMRLDFAAGAEVREWCDRAGQTLVRGRMVDFYNELVVLDVEGVRREIPLRDLCDVDLAYIGKMWNLPISCGSGHDRVAARDFVPSAMQWKASGLCHKPLYFEEVQLERYGHEVGPVLQPLISTAHFFGNIAVLPYKMGIHPPHECQYALGYYRPGDCAPYMLPPIPFSLRGAAVQAGAVVGASALIP